VFDGNEVRLLERPADVIQEEHFGLARVRIPGPRTGEITVRNLLMSVDPYMRSKLKAGPSYTVAYEVGAVLEADAVGTVVDSRAPSAPVGTMVRSRFGWRDFFTVDAEGVEVLAPGNFAPSAFLGALGMTGQTAFVGLFNVADIQAGETVFVSASAGAVGSIAAQLAKLHGCRVVGSAGSEEKVRFLREDLGLDGAFNYRDTDVEVELAMACPEGIDVYFDNVGGIQLQAAITMMRSWGRIALCGAVSQGGSVRAGIDNLETAIGRRLRIQGFLVSDYAADEHTFTERMTELLQGNRLRTPERIFSGLRQAPAALIELLAPGGQPGKYLVDLGKDAP
jgi:NADPH-dependent curcumin reductase CurA